MTRILTRFLLCFICFAINAAAQQITNFGENVGYGPIVGGTWSYNGTTSTAAGTNSNGNSLLGTFATEQNFSGSNQINLTAEVNGSAPSSSFLFTLFGQDGATASAVFTWSSFMTPSTQVSSLTPIVPSTMQNVNAWQILSLYNGGAPLPLSVTFTTANATAGPAPAAGIGGPVLTGFGNAASSSGTWSYSSGTSTISGTTSDGDAISGSSAVQNYGSATQISLTASANVSQGTPFTYVLVDAEGDQAYAAFNWANFNGGVKTVASNLVMESFFDPTNVQSWQILSGRSGVTVNATLYGAAAVSPSNTETVVDDFSVSMSQVAAVGPAQVSGPAQNSGQVGGFTATRQATAASQTSGTDLALEVAGGEFIGGTTGTASSLGSLEYSGFNLYLTGQNYLRFDFSDNNSPLDVVITLTNPDFVSSIEGTFSVGALTGPESFYVDLTLFSGYQAGFLSQVTSLNIDFLSLNAPSGRFYSLDKIAFTSVPEPSVCGMLALGGAVWLLRKRPQRRA